MRVIIIGGHLSPALSIIEKLPKTDKVLFIGRKYVFEGDQALSLEYKTIQSLKIPFVNLITGRLQRKFTKHTIPSLLKLPYGFMRSILALIKFQPDVVLSFGGYLSFPVVLSGLSAPGPTTRGACRRTASVSPSRPLPYAASSSLPA